MLEAPPSGFVWVVAVGDPGTAHLAALDPNSVVPGTILPRTACEEPVSHQVSADTADLDSCTECEAEL